jgi:calnexin
MQAPEEAARLAEEAEAFLTAGPEGGFAFWESFQSDWKESGRWVISENEKYKGESSDDSAPRGVCEPCSTTLPCLGSGAVEWAQVPDSVEGDMALWLNSTAAHHAVSTKFNKPVTNEGTTLVVQYEVRLTKGLDCGGAYIKLFTHDDSIKLADFHDQVAVH